MLTGQKNKTKNNIYIIIIIVVIPIVLNTIIIIIIIVVLVVFLLSIWSLLLIFLLFTIVVVFVVVIIILLKSCHLIHRIHDISTIFKTHLQCCYYFRPLYHYFSQSRRQTVAPECRGWVASFYFLLKSNGVENIYIYFFYCKQTSILVRCICLCLYRLFYPRFPYKSGKI